MPKQLDALIARLSSESCVDDARGAPALDVGAAPAPRAHTLAERRMMIREAFALWRRLLNDMEAAATRVDLVERAEALARMVDSLAVLIALENEAYGIGRTGAAAHPGPLIAARTPPTDLLQ